MQVNDGASCHSKFVIHEVMDFVTNLKVHLRGCTENVNIDVLTMVDHS